MAAISNRTEPVAVAYDARGGRRTKTFADPFAARRFYVAMHKAGRRPAVINPSKETMAMAKKQQPKKAPRGKPTPAGSKRARIRAALTRQPKKMKQLMAEAGVDQTHYNFLNGLVQAGEVVKTPDGYRLK